MKRTLAATLGGTVFVAFASASWADQPGWYVSGLAGATFLSNADNIFESFAVDGIVVEGLTLKTEHDPGFGVAGAVGYEFGNGVRLEGEIGYRQNDLDTIKLVGVEGDFSDGDLSTLSFMSNLFYDFTFGFPHTGSPWKPYVVGGIGVAEVSINNAVVGTFSVDGMPVPELPNLPFADDENTVFAYQAGAGIGYAVNQQTTVSLDYRYFATEDPSFTDVDGLEFESDYETHNVSLSLRYRF